MRLFVGVPIPQTIKQEVIKLQKELNGGLNLVEPENLHFTLKFLGEVKENKEIEEKLEFVAKKHKPFNVEVKRVGAFPNTKSIRVVWVGINENKEFVDLVKDVQKELDYIRKEDYNEIKIHLTVARVRSSGQGLLKVIEKHKDKDFGSFTVNGFNLYKSVLGMCGSTYGVVREFGLNDKSVPTCL